MVFFFVGLFPPWGSFFCFFSFASFFHRGLIKMFFLRVGSFGRFFLIFFKGGAVFSFTIGLSRHDATILRSQLEYRFGGIPLFFYPSSGPF